MVYQIIQESPWYLIFGTSGILLIPAMVLFLIFSKLGPKLTVGIFVAGCALVIACMIGVFVGGQQRVDQNDTNFSKQLMDEYGVTSSRSMYEINLDFSRFDEARTVFTKDGKEIPVYIKLVHKDDNQVTMDFTVIDEKSLFPKLNK